MGLSKGFLNVVTAVTLLTVLPAAPVSFLAHVPALSVAPAYADELGGKEVTVEGEGENKEGAVAAARRQAVETALGAYVTSVTDVKNFQVVKDEIKTSAEGYVSDIEILEEKAG